MKTNIKIVRSQNTYRTSSNETIEKIYKIKVYRNKTTLQKQSLLHQKIRASIKPKILPVLNQLQEKY